jgi:hypothetical protein
MRLDLLHPDARELVALRLRLRSGINLVELMSEPAGNIGDLVLRVACDGSNGLLLGGEQRRGLLEMKIV